MKKYFLLSSLLTVFLAKSQQSNVAAQPLYIKANTLLLPAGMLNAAAEFGLTDKMTLQTEIFVSPWKSFFGKYFQFYMVGIDGRYYFDQAFKHWYVGANFSAARFIMQKWNYWGSTPYQYAENQPIYIASDLYQDGFSLFFGAVAGYQFSLGERWNLDAYVGAGSAQSFYRGYHKELGVRYDIDPTRDYNRSGEWIPYRGGLMLSYKLR